MNRLQEKINDIQKAMVKNVENKKEESNRLREKIYDMEVKRKNKSKLKEKRYNAEKQLILDSLSKARNELPILKIKIQEITNKTEKQDKTEFKVNSRNIMFASKNEEVNKNMTLSKNNKVRITAIINKKRYWKELF